MGLGPRFSQTKPALAVSAFVFVGVLAFAGSFYRLKHTVDKPAPLTATPAAAESAGDAKSDSDSVLTKPVGNLEPETGTSLPELRQGAERGEDIADVLLLYDSEAPQNFDVNFCMIATFYGLLCERADLNSVPITDALLRDKYDEHFKLVGISAAALQSGLIDDTELKNLRAVIERDGVNLFVAKMKPEHEVLPIYQLTGNAILGVERVEDSVRDWEVTTAVPEITREFSGQSIAPEAAWQQADYAIKVGRRGEEVTPLITSTGDLGETYPVLVKWQRGEGAVFVDSGMADESLEDSPLAGLYLDKASFTQIIPLMFTLRYTLGEEVWHNDHSYANLTIDDPPLQSPAKMTGGNRYLDYRKLLPEMNEHDFHTTVAFIPRNWKLSEEEIAQLFFNNPEYFSLVQHGNNHDGFEFYKYVISDEDEWEARPFVDQEFDIVEGLSRMWLHTERAGIPFDQVMVFPYGNAPAPTLAVLKQYNYMAVIQDPSYPLDTPDSERWDFLMVPANFEYENFPMVRRIPITDIDQYDPIKPVYRLFLDRPALLYSHAGELFQSGINSFSPIADLLNNLEGEIDWSNLGKIIQHLYLEKINDDGSVDVRMYSNNNLIISNNSNESRTYHVTKEESLNVPIVSVKVNDQSFDYVIHNGYMQIDVVLATHSTMGISIEFGQ